MFGRGLTSALIGSLLIVLTAAGCTSATESDRQSSGSTVLTTNTTVSLPTPPDTSSPDTSSPDTSRPDTSSPDTSSPDTSRPDISGPDTIDATPVQGPGEDAAIVATIENACDGACCSGIRDVPTLIAYEDGLVLLPDQCTSTVTSSWIDPEWLRSSVSDYLASDEAQIVILDVGGANTPGLDVADGGSEILTLFGEDGSSEQIRGHALGTEDLYPQYFPADQLLARRALRAELESIRAAAVSRAQWDPESVTMGKVAAADVLWEEIGIWPEAASTDVQLLLTQTGLSCLQTSNAAVVALLTGDKYRPTKSWWKIGDQTVGLELLPVLPGYPGC